MQQILFLDYMDGSKDINQKIQINHPELVVLLAAFRLAPLLNVRTNPINGEWADTTNYLKATKEQYPQYIFEAVEEYIKENDNIMPLLDYSLFNQRPKKNYVFSKNLTSALSETKIEKACSLGLEERGFYFEMPGVNQNGTQLICTYGYTMRVPSDGSSLLVIQNVIKHNGYYRTFVVSFAMNHARLLSDQFEEYMRGKYVEEFFGTEKVGYDSPSLIRTVLNGVVYIFNNSEEMTEKINQFSTKKSKLETEKKIFTQKPYVELGGSFEFLRLIQEGTVGVRGHYRWQPCGEGRREVKLTYVRPHSKTISRILETS